MKTSKDNLVLFLYLGVLLVSLLLPYLDLGQKDQVMTIAEPSGFIPLLFLIVLTFSLFLVKDEKVNYYLVCAWLILTGIGTWVAFVDLWNGLDMDVNYIGSSVFWQLVLFPVAIAYWAIQRFKK